MESEGGRLEPTDYSGHSEARDSCQPGQDGSQQEVVVNILPAALEISNSGSNTNSSEVVEIDASTSNGMEVRNMLFNMSSEVGSREESDKLILSAMMPVEMWQSVLNQVEDNQIMENLSNASLVFRSMLLAKRTQFLFPKVLDLVYSSERNEQVLNWRFVCKKWNQAIDFKLKDKGLGEYYRFIDPDEFIKHFKKTHPPGSFKSPFVNGALHIQNTHDEWLDEIQILLNSYGLHILHVDMAFWQDSYDYWKFGARDYGSIIFKFMKLMPFLKCMNVSIVRFSGDHEVVLPPIREYPIPYFNNLQELDLQVEASIFNAVLAKCQQVVVLAIRDIENMSEIDIGNFASLQLKHLAFCYAFHKIDVDALENILSSGIGDQLVWFQLKSIEHYVSWSKVLLILGNRWGDTLERLDLELPKSFGLEVEAEILHELEAMQAFKYKLAKLKQVHIEMQNIVPLDFLFAAEKTLEILEVWVKYPAIKKEFVNLVVGAFTIQKLDILENIFSLEKSNIWNFPYLQSVKYVLTCESQPLRLAVGLLTGISLESDWLKGGFHYAKCTREMVNNVGKNSSNK